MNRRLLGRLACVAGLLMLPALARAVPAISSISPSKTAANNGETVTVYCSDCGYSTDRVYFPGGGFVNPTSWSLNNWVTVRVPATWSGSVYMLKQGAGSASNSVNHDISYNWSGQKWPSFPFTWYLNSGGAPGATFNDTRDALTAGYNAWSCASGASMTYGGSTAIATTANDGTNCRYWSNTGWSSGTIAVATWFYNTTTNNIVEADIGFNAQHYTWSAYGTATTMSVENIGTHEEGHTLGLLDMYGAADAAKTMYGYGANGETQKNTLDNDDVLGAEYMYPHSRANFASGTPAGWYWTVVPRNTADATGSSATLPATLNGNATTYWNAAMTNNGGDCAAPGGTNQLYLDDDYQWDLYWGGVWGAGATYGLWTNLATYVRGGRHTLRESMDTNNETIESNEFDNTFATQYVFSPATLTDQVPIARILPPQRGSGTYANCDGFKATGNWWTCVAITPYTTGDDYDLYMHNDYTGSTGGFAGTVASSAAGGPNTDFVLANGNNAGVGYGATRYFGVVRYAAAVGDAVLMHQSNQVGGTLYPSTTYGALVSTGTVTMGAYDIVKVHEVYLASTTTAYRFHLENLTGSADLNISLYAASGDYFGKSGSVASSQSIGAGTNEEFSYTPPATGYYGVVVWKRGNGDIGSANNYELRVGAALSNLSATVTPGGFTAPIVPRNAAGAAYGNAVLTATLDGNASTTYLNWNTQNLGPNPTPGWGGRVYLDTESYVAYDGVGSPNNPGSWQAINVGTLNIRGGRHSLTHYADYDNVVEESNESDNDWTGQWVWSPLNMTIGAPLVRSLPPDAGGFPYPNSDGFKLDPVDAQAWVVSGAGLVAGDDYDMAVADNYSSSTSGFSNFVGYSAYGGNLTDFVVGQYGSSYGTLYYPASVRYYPGGGGYGMAVDNSNDVGRYSSLPSAQWTGQVLPAYRLADVYEANLQAGTTYRFLLWRSGGSDDLGFEIFPGTYGGIYARGYGLGISVTSASDQDTLEFTPASTGWHPIVVYRQSGSNAGSPQTYTFAWNTNVIVAVDDQTPKSLEFAGVAPNPMRGPGRFHFALPQASDVKLELFDLNGRRVTTVAEAPYNAGVHDVAWDGADANGRRVDAGLYWARFTAAGQTITKRVSVMR